MYSFLLCLIVITILNLLCIVFGFMLALAKESIKENPKEWKSFIMKEKDLEEAYIPEED